VTIADAGKMARRPSLGFADAGISMLGPARIAS
jgi:hypothetical protein